MTTRGVAALAVVVAVAAAALMLMRDTDRPNAVHLDESTARARPDDSASGPLPADASSLPDTPERTVPDVLSPVADGEASARIVGEVVDAETREPVEDPLDVEIEISTTEGHRRATTTSAGGGRFTFVVPAPATLIRARVISHGEYVGEIRSFSTELPDGAVEVFSLTAARGAWVEGTVVDEAGTPIAQATVNGWRESYGDLDRDRSVAPDVTTTTGGSGRFRVGPFHGEYTVEGSTPRLVCGQRISGRANAGETYRDLTIILCEPGELRGRVLDHERQPVVGVGVTAYPAPTGRSYFKAGSAAARLKPSPSPRMVTSAGGWFHATRLPMFPHALVVDDGRHPRHESVHDVGDLDIEIVLRPGGRLVGMVHAAGQPVASAYVRFENGPRQIEITETGEDGAYAVTGVDVTDSGVLLVHAPSYAVAVVERIALVADREARVDVALEPERVVAGRVVDGDGAPLGLIRVEIEGERDVETYRGRTSARPTWERCSGLGSVHTGGDGRFRFRSLYPGMFTVTAFARPPSRYKTSLRVAAGRDDLEVVLAPDREPRVTLIGRVRDRITGDPIAAFDVTPMLPLAEGVTSGNATRFHDPDGGFLLSDLMPGHMRVMVRAEGYVSHTLPDREYLAGSHELEFRLAPVRTLKLRVVDAYGEPVAGARLHFRDAEGQQCMVDLGNGARSSSILTDATGAVTASGLPAMRVQVLVELRGGEQVEAEYDLTYPQDAERLLRVEP